MRMFASGSSSWIDMVNDAIAAFAALYAAMNGTGKREASDVTLMIKPFPRPRIAASASRINCR